MVELLLLSVPFFDLSDLECPMDASNSVSQNKVPTHPQAAASLVLVAEMGSSDTVLRDTNQGRP